MCATFSASASPVGLPGQRLPEADDLPLERHAGRRLHARAHGLAQPLDVLARGAAGR